MFSKWGQLMMTLVVLHRALSGGQAAENHGSVMSLGYHLRLTASNTFKNSSSDK